MGIVAGVDFGTLSVRVTLIDRDRGRLGTASAQYPLNRRREDPDFATQSHKDQMDALVSAMRAVLADTGTDGKQIVALALDTTGSSVIPVDRNLQPLDDYLLWCDHRAHREAQQITQLAHAENLEAIEWCGGVYSHEWGFAKLLYWLRNNPEKRANFATALEHCDMVAATLIGCTDPNLVPRSICAMGHKWMWNPKWGGLPPQSFLSRLDPLFDGIREKLTGQFSTSNAIAGRLSTTWADKLGLTAGIPIPVGAFDAHWDAIGAGCREGDVVNVVGTSTCIIAIARKTNLVPGVCGVVPGSVHPSYTGIEAGLSATGDIFEAIARRSGSNIRELSRGLETYHAGQTGLLRLSWDNGDRTVLVNPELGGVTLGWNLLHTAQDELFAAIEGTAFHTRIILDRMAEYGVPVERVINAGGIPQNNAVLNQVYADVLGKPVLVPDGVPTSLGSGIFAFLQPENSLPSRQRRKRYVCHTACSPLRPRLTGRIRNSIHSTVRYTLPSVSATPHRQHWATSCLSCDASRWRYFRSLHRRRLSGNEKSSQQKTTSDHLTQRLGESISWPWSHATILLLVSVQLTKCTPGPPMKKLINRSEAVVEEMLQGSISLNPSLVRLSNLNIVMRSDFDTIRDRQVALISGGGSGHEPAHAGYIGEGMLSAAVAGEIFTSPSVDSIYAAIKVVAGKPGVLLIVKNYTGDRLNFGLAAEMARAEGIAVRMVIVDDDVALLDAHRDNNQQTAGGRGLAGVVLLHKIAGAAAAEGASLDEVTETANALVKAMGTMGFALSAGTSPTLGKPGFTLGDNEIELGLGIHGEPGVRRTSLASADQLADTLIETIISARKFRSSERLAVLVNNLGSTTTMEIDIVSRHALTALTSRNFTVERLYAGTLLTSLDMAGVSITILPVDDERLRRLDATTTAPAWPNFPRKRPTPVKERVSQWSVPLSLSIEPLWPPQTAHGRRAEQAIRAACNSLLNAEALLTKLDQVVGDGDLGISLARASKALLDALPRYPLDDIPTTLKQIGQTLQTSLGGSSGPLYGVLFIRAGSVMQRREIDDLKQWAEALSEACEAISKLGGAIAGDRTMLDSLIPFAATLTNSAAHSKPAKALLEDAVIAAALGAERTAQMFPRRGRSSYLGERALGHPDPGAVAVSIWLRSVIASI